MDSPFKAARFQSLRKPMTSLVSLTAGAPQLRPPTKADSPAACCGEIPTNSADKIDASPLPACGLPALTLVFCNYCGQQGNFRCNSCKKVPYCSVACQKEDWKSHKHVCTYIEKRAKAPSKETVSRPTQVEQKLSSPLSTQKVYLKDLPVRKFVEGVEMQASVLEFYSPSRFFVFFQSSEMMEALTNITSELQRVYSLPSASSYVPSAGEICAVQFSCDLKWYRGLIQTVTDDQKVANVLYIDFGNVEDVPMDRIRSLAANLKPFSPCALECCIAGVLPAVDTWSGECCTVVKGMVADSVVTVCLVKPPEHDHSYAVDVLLPMGKLSALLVDFGYAKKETANAHQVTPTKREMDEITSASLENFKRLSDGKDDNAWAKPPEPLTQAVGDRLSVVVIHFQSPADFIVQKVDNARAIQDLQLKLREHCGQVAAPKNFRPAPGTVCCAQFSEDKQWYRAKILAYSSEERVCVGYIDFGNSEEVDLSHLRPISASLLELPMQVMPCGLAGVQPIGESWSEDCIVAFKSRVSNRILQVEIEGAQDSKVLVVMTDEASDPQANVAELLISAGYATPAAAVPAAAEPADAATRRESQADQTAPPVQPNGPPPVCEPLVWHNAELPCDGQTVAVQDIVAVNPGEFYCRISSPADQQQLLELAAQLKLHCEADSTSFVPKVGEPCCAMYPGDGTWRRAMVKELSAGGVTVSFVDHGNSMIVETSHVRSITPELLRLPFQALRCWLTGVEPLGSDWSSESVLLFLTLVDGQRLSARIVSVTERGFGVELESRGQSVAAALLSDYLAIVQGEPANETRVKTGGKAGELGQMQAGTTRQTEAACEEAAAVPLGEPSFPVNWKATALPFNYVKPGVAAAINPSLFFVLGPAQGDCKPLQELMEQLDAYCCKHQAALSAAARKRPAPGAACCAQFSVDDAWYRAVVLAVGDDEAKVISADYGNVETMPFSRILPIPKHLLQLPFRITRCSLLGREQFPEAWPGEVAKMFDAVLSSGVFATAHSFNGLANTLSLTLPTESGEKQVVSMVLDALRAHKTHVPLPAASKSEQRPGGDLPGQVPNTQSGLKDVTGESRSVEDRATSLQQKKRAAAAAHEHGVKTIVNQMDPPWNNISESSDKETTCCCLSLKTQMDHMEQLLEQQLSLIKQIVGQKQ